MDYRSIGAGTESGGRGTASELGICAGPIFRLADPLPTRPVNGSIFCRKNKELEPELAREEMDKLAQTRVDALKVSGRLPSADQVIRDVEDLIAEVHPGYRRSQAFFSKR
jgi:hypothetical protein